MALYTKEFARKMYQAIQSSKASIKVEDPIEHPSFIDLTDAEAVTAQPDIAKKLNTTTTNLSRTPTAHFQGKISSPTHLKLTMPAAHLPPTPEPTPDHQLTRGTKRAAPTEPDSPSIGRSHKRLATTSPTHNTFTEKPSTVVKDTRPPTTPISSISRNSIYCLNPKYAIVQSANGPVKIYQDKLCSLELRRLAREVMCQVDWEVAEDNIACNRPCVVYRRLVRRMLLEKADELEAEESDSDDEEEVKLESEEEVKLESEEEVKLEREEEVKLESEVGDEGEEQEFESELDFEF